MAIPRTGNDSTPISTASACEMKEWFVDDGALNIYVDIDDEHKHIAGGFKIA
jgi:hypothetical protein